jgi:hypothetical protein
MNSFQPIPVITGFVFLKYEMFRRYLLLPALVALAQDVAGPAPVVVQEGTCADNGNHQRIMTPNVCLAAAHRYFGLSSDVTFDMLFVSLYGEPGCDIGAGGVTYGFCQGPSISKPTGCSVNNRGNLLSLYSLYS